MEKNGDFSTACMTPQGAPKQNFLLPSKRLTNKGLILLMAEILHHLGCMKPYK